MIEFKERKVDQRDPNANSYEYDQHLQVLIKGHF